jgi:hypothetical protein
LPVCGSVAADVAATPQAFTTRTAPVTLSAAGSRGGEDDVALTREQLLAYAAEQIRTAERLLAEHRPTATGACACARPLPCPQARSLEATRERYRHQVALLEQTQRLPVVPAPAGPLRPHRRITVLARLARLWRSPRGDV